MIGAVNCVFPLFLRLHDQLTRIVLDEADAARLRDAVSGRALLIANHPSESEPVVLYGLSRLLGQQFYFVATHEIFHGPRGWVTNRVGAFSIHRGRPDRTSLRMSRMLLAEQDQKLVIFPEGETHMQNDLVLPFHSGAVQIGFWVLERLEELGREPQLPVVPVAVRYRYVDDPTPALARGLGRLESHLGLCPHEAPGGTLADRLVYAGVAVLEGIEREYAFPPEPRRIEAAALDARIATLYRHIGQRVARVVNVPFPQEEPVPVGMRMLFNATFDFQDALAEGESRYARRLHRRRTGAARTCLHDLWRLQNFMVISGDCLAPPVSAERFGEVLWRLEVEVTGRARTRPLREAVVRIGEPLALETRLPHYRRNRREAVATCCGELEALLRGQLESMAALGRPMAHGCDPQRRNLRPP